MSNYKQKDLKDLQLSWVVRLLNIFKCFFFSCDDVLEWQKYIKIGTLKRTCVYCECDLKFEQLEVNVSN